MYGPGERVVKSCADIRCTPCYPRGFCRWRHTIVEDTSGPFTTRRSNWEMIASQCSPYCECETNPPHSYSGVFSAFRAPYADGEVIDVPCCRSPIENCVPTSTTTTQTPTSTTSSTTTTVPPTSTSSSTTPPTTTLSPTTGCPTVGPRTTAPVKFIPFLDEDGNDYGPDCQLFCYRKCPDMVRRNVDGVFQCFVFSESYEAIWVGMPGPGEYGTKLCYPWVGGSGVPQGICELSKPCNASNVGMISGKCRRKTGGGESPNNETLYPDGSSGERSNCQR